MGTVKNFEDATVCFVDNGLFCDFFLRYADQFKRSLYWSPWATAFPKSNSMLIGDGFKTVEKIRYMWDYVDEIDLWVFPDVYYSDVQVQLAKMGKRVFGARTGEDFELFREDAKEIIAKAGLAVAPWSQIVGLKALREHLKASENQWVKVSTTRGDFETFHSPSYELIMPRLDELEWRLGAKKDIYKFVVEDGIDDCVEIGYDGWTIDGQYPSPIMTAYELKDLGMVGRVVDYEDLAEPVKLVNERLSPYFKQHQYRGFFASELRVGKDRVPYLIDPCARCGTPSNELLQEFFTNWPEVWWNGAEGEIVTPEKAWDYGVIAMIHSSWSNNNWQAIYFPESVRQWVKLRNHTMIDGNDYVVPTEVGLPEIGGVIGVGNSLDEAIAHLTSNASKIEGYDLDIKLDAIGNALDIVKQGEEYGISFCSEGEIPKAERLHELISEDT